jgi:heavy metal translocating P-type ATPase
VSKGAASYVTRDHRPARLRRAATLIARYPLVPATVVVGIFSALLALLAPPPWSFWVAGAYALGVAAWVAIGMFRDIRSGRWGIDVLAIVAVVSTVLVGDHWAALIVVLMITGGQALEDYASHRAEEQLRALLDRTPRVAHRQRDDGQNDVEEVPVDEVRIGDLLIVKPGETIPIDSDLLDEDAELDESSLTGESLPAAHVRGDRIRSGIVATSSTVHVRTVALARDSEYQQIVRMVQDAAGTKGRFIRMADRVAVPFTLVALAIGAVAWALAGDPVRFAEVLVVATPCPLLIAAPAAIVAGMGLASKRGIVVKDGDTLSKLARPAVMAFDKTGTLTIGAPEVVRVEPQTAGGEHDLIAVAAALEAGSAHVLARAIVRAAGADPLPVVDHLTEQPGLGLEGDVGGAAVRVGRPAYVGASERPVGPGESAVYVARDGTQLGRIVLSDGIRPDAAPVLARLRTLGVRSFLVLSGDAPATTEAVAAMVGIEDARGGLLPGQKLAAIAAVAEHPVVMVGDGVNDAPVLAAADVGVAMGARGATAASESADAVILSDSLEPLGDAVAIARRTRRIAVQSIVVGVSLSVALMLVATTGVLPATAGALLQEFVDLVTILNGLRAARPPAR